MINQGTGNKYITGHGLTSPFDKFEVWLESYDFDMCRLRDSVERTIYE